MQQRSRIRGAPHLSRTFFAAPGVDSRQLLCETDRCGNHGTAEFNASPLVARHGQLTTHNAVRDDLTQRKNNVANPPGCLFNRSWVRYSQVQC